MNLDPRIPDGRVEDKWDNHRFELKLVNPANKRKYDVIIVGSGLAGGSAAAGETGSPRSADHNPARFSICGWSHEENFSRYSRSAVLNSR